MSDTTAVQLDYLARMNRTSAPTGQPLCPACLSGRLHPYLVEINLTEIPGRGWHGADSLFGWVAVCVGNADYNRLSREEYEARGEAWDDEVVDQTPCGFSMPMTPR